MFISQDQTKAFWAECEHFTNPAFQNTLQNIDIVTAITSSGLKRIRAPLWVRGQDAFLVIRRSQD